MISKLPNLTTLDTVNVLRHFRYGIFIGQAFGVIA
jgi:hypothetical protein